MSSHASLQAISKDGQSSQKLLVQMSLLEGTSSGLDGLLAKVSASVPAGALIAEVQSDDDAVSLGSDGVVLDKEEDAYPAGMKRPGSGEIDMKSR